MNPTNWLHHRVDLIDVNEYILKDNNFIMTLDYEDTDTETGGQSKFTNDIDFKIFFQLLRIDIGTNYDMNIQIPYDDNKYFKIMYIKFIIIIFTSNLIYLIEQYKKIKVHQIQY